MCAPLIDFTYEPATVPTTAPVKSDYVESGIIPAVFPQRVLDKFEENSFPELIITICMFTETKRINTLVCMFKSGDSRWLKSGNEKEKKVMGGLRRDDGTHLPYGANTICLF